MELQDWGGPFYRNFRRKKEAYRNLLDILRPRRDAASVMEFKAVEKKLHILLAQEEVYWKQRAKQHWLQEGDNNTSYFHHYASGRKRKNEILRLRGINGNWIDGSDLHNDILEYFGSIFKSSQNRPLDMARLPFPTISPEQNCLLLRPFDKDEIRAALFSMHPDKAPGPDGMNPKFFQHYWPVIENDVSEFILDCLNNNRFPEGFGDANVVLIPKKNCPEAVADLRPIALCNTVYKILAKTLANRIKGVLSSLISEAQCAFVPNRLITDNILIAAETGHYLRRKLGGGYGWAGIKLDMAKAYDRMEWSFVRAILTRFGFDPKWVSWIMLCIESARYCFKVNGELIGPVIPTRGLRQGDPLSPYLFILCAECLSILLSDAQTKGHIHGCRVARGAPAITHLLFADDSLLFFRAKAEEAMNVKRCLSLYEQASGQAINFQKSCITFSVNTNHADRDLVSTVFQVQQADGLGKYLGLPAVIGRNREEAFSFIEGKLRNRIGAWHKKLLSRAGKEILLKCVAQALPTYTMSVYLLPNSLCDSLQKAMNKYWWSGGNRGGGVHWMSWERLASPKSHGGLGFKQLHNFNIALLAKQGWRILSNPGALVSKVFKARYFPSSSFLQAAVGNNPSLVWRSIMAGQCLLRRGTARRIGNGRETNIWRDPWLHDHITTRITTIPAPGYLDSRVSSLILPGRNSWNSGLLRVLFNHEDVERIEKTPVNADFADSWYWKDDVRGCYSVKSGYRLLSTLPTPMADFKSWKKLWNLEVAPKIRNFLWRCVKGVIPVLETLHRRRIDVNSLCPLCDCAEETWTHFCFECSIVKQTWVIAGVEPDFVGPCFNTWLENLLTSKDMATSCWYATLLWFAWCGRNNFV